MFLGEIILVPHFQEMEVSKTVVYQSFFEIAGVQ